LAQALKTNVLKTNTVTSKNRNFFTSLLLWGEIKMIHVASRNVNS